MKRLTKNEMNTVANSMIYQCLKGFGIHAIEQCNISEEQKEKIILIIHEKAEKFNNNYSHIGNTVDLVNNIIEMRA